MIAQSTVNDLVFQALRTANIVSLKDPVPDSIFEEALLILNAIRAGLGLNTKNYVIYDQTTTIATAPGQPNIVLGPGGDITTRPASVTQVVITLGGIPGGVNIAIPIKPYELYRTQPVTQVFSVPQECYIDTSYPGQNIWFFPGIALGYSVRVQGTAYMTDYENISDVYMDPPEYWEPLSNLLATRLAPKYGGQCAPDVYPIAKSALDSIRDHNFLMRLKPMTNGLGGGDGVGISFWAGM